MVTRRSTYFGPQVARRPQSNRVQRSPRHTFYIKSRPWQIVPFMIAPVLPGETLKNLTFNARVVTDPIVNPLQGWWLETYFFYVKMRDLDIGSKLIDFMMDPSTDLSAYDGATSRPFYHVNGTLSPSLRYTVHAVDRIVNCYFRNEGELSSDFILGDYHTASVNMKNFMDSAVNEDDYIAATAIPDDNLVSTTPGQGDGTAAVRPSEIIAAMQEYEYAALMGFTDMTWEDWCEEYRPNMFKRAEIDGVPELLRRISEWQLPSNTIDPSNGTPRSAVSWSMRGRADKARMFKEPGWIIGISVMRPKVLFKNLTAAAAHYMNQPKDWMHPSMMTSPWDSFKAMPAGDAPLDANTDAYYWDVKDLLLHGDQWVNADLGSALPTGWKAPNVVALPNAGLTNKWYPASTDADALFVTNTAGQGGAYHDGVVELTILGQQVETSPTNLGNFTPPVLPT